MKTMCFKPLVLACVAGKRMLTAALLLVLAGCSQEPPLDFTEVVGKVTLNNKPLRGAVVRFYPLRDTREQLPFSTGLTDSAGTFTLSHEGKKPGAVVGRSRVVVYWPSRDLRAALSMEEETPLTVGVPIPPRYTVATDSPLTVDVKAGGPQTIDLSLAE